MILRRLIPPCQAFLLYSAFGGLATAVHYGILYSLVESAYLSPPTSTLVGSFCGAFVSYVLNRNITFLSQRAGLSATFVKFMLVAAIGSLVNFYSLFQLTKYIDTHYLIIQASTTAAILFFSFFLNRNWTFGENNE